MHGHQPNSYAFNQALIDTNPLDAIALMFASVQQLGWTLGEINEVGFDAYTNFSGTSWDEDISLRITENGLQLKSTNASVNETNSTNNKANIDTILATYTELKNNLSDDALQELRIKFTNILNYSKEETSNVSNSPADNPDQSLLAIFKPVKGYFVTPILINLNILVYILMVISGVHFLDPDSESLLTWGANYRPATLDGEAWRLLTCCFVHIGALHLLMNMYALLFIGMLLEPFLGKMRFLVAYLATGLIASVASMWWNELSVGAGASGAIFGMYGVFLALLSTNIIEKNSRKALLTSILIFVGFNLLNGLKEDIDNAAHLGGLLSGFIVGLAFIPGIRKPERFMLRQAITVALIILTLAGSTFVYFKLPNTLKVYENKMQAFENMQTLALEFYYLPDTASKEQQLYKLNETGIHYWNENIKMLTELNKLKLPESIRERNQLLIEYCKLRVQSYRLFSKKVEAQNETYHDSIIYYDSCIMSYLKILNDEKK